MIAVRASRLAGTSLTLAPRTGQIALLAASNVFVGGMVGVERSILPDLASREFGIASSAAVLSFIAAFGVAKAFTNLLAGRAADRFGRRPLLIAGWLIGAPVPLLLIFAPSWGWVVGANVLLGLNQGLCWSMTVNMKIDLAAPRHRGFVLGLNESAGYLGVAAAALGAGVLASHLGLRPEPLYLSIAFVAVGLAIAVLLVEESQPRIERVQPAVSLRSSFARGSWGDRSLVAVSQAGLVNNLNDALAWGIFPLYFASRGLSLDRVAFLAAAYPFVWGVLQLATGWLSDIAGRARLIVAGMMLQAAAIASVVTFAGFGAWLLAVAALGAGTALAYPTLLAAAGDAAAPGERATTLGVYRFWRDMGTVAGALAAGVVADLAGFRPSIAMVAALTAGSGLLALSMMHEPAGQPAAAAEAP